MNRRDWMRTVAVSPAMLSAAPAPRDPAIEVESFRIKTKHTWTTTMSSSDYRDVLYFRYISGGITGHGEGAPIVRYHESAETGGKAIESITSLLLASDPWKYRKILKEVFA